jgi:hypothetical protein
MPRYYVISGKKVNTVNTTIIYLASADSVRPKIYDLVLGSDATPADNAAEYVVQRFTAEHATPGGNLLTPRKLDTSDSAAASSGREAPTGEPTYTAGEYLLRWPQNQRLTFRWIAAPGGELVLPAAANNGAGLVTLTVAGSSVSTLATIFFQE